MMARTITLTIAAIGLALLGIWAGRCSVAPTSRPPQESEVDRSAVDDGHDHEAGDDHDHDAPGHDHAGDDHDHDAPGHVHAEDDADHAAEDDAHDHPHFSEQALRNMGVTRAPLKVETYLKRREVLGTITATARNSRPITAPIGGLVVEVLADPGMVAPEGVVLLRYLRDPIPRPTLELTGEVLTPAREAVHQSVAELRRTQEEVTIFEEELARVSKFTETEADSMPVLPRQTAIDLRYQLLRAKRAYEQARLELQKHGFSIEQIGKMAAGDTIPDLGQETWRRALEHNGLWTDAASRLFETLPDALKADRWAVATVAEMAAGGLASDELVALLASEKTAAAHFLEIGALLQKGMSVAEISRLAASGALEPLVTILAPDDGDHDDWDVAEVLVQPGSRIAKGERMLVLSDHCRLRLRIDPVGGEQATALAVLGVEGACSARPLVTGSGPEIEAITLDQATGDETGQGTRIWARLDNSVAHESTDGQGRRFRSWSLRPGLRFLVGIPQHAIDEAFVLPLAALTTIGPDTVVFVEDGDSFRAVPVVVAHRDQRHAVISVDDAGDLFSGDRVVMSGAYALGLAMNAGATKVDAHAGHGH